MKEAEISSGSRSKLEVRAAMRRDDGRTADLLLVKLSGRLKVPDGRPLGKGLDLVCDDGSEASSFGLDRLLRDDREFPEGDN
jgi:hypothetical protein